MTRVDIRTIVEPRLLLPKGMYLPWQNENASFFRLGSVAGDLRRTWWYLRDPSLRCRRAGGGATFESNCTDWSHPLGCNSYIGIVSWVEGTKVLLLGCQSILFRPWRLHLDCLLPTLTDTHRDGWEVLGHCRRSGIFERPTAFIAATSA